MVAYTFKLSLDGGLACLERLRASQCFDRRAHLGREGGREGGRGGFGACLERLGASQSFDRRADIGKEGGRGGGRGGRDELACMARKERTGIS